MHHVAVDQIARLQRRPLAALPADLQTAEAIEGLLLPVPNPDLATASFAIEDEESLEQLLTALILDPRFNLK